MTREEIIKGLSAVKKECGKQLGESFAWMDEIFQEAIEELEQEPNIDMGEIKEIVECDADLETTQRWIPVSERLPNTFEFVNCTCHSLIDDRNDWVIETAYVPQLPDSPYSDWGNIPMLNSGDCEVIAWMCRDIPEPYKAEKESEE